ncbi:flagellar protein FlaI [Methanolobus vulcani]|uniref:Flagellar protein FlaI n=1 Tax=Methanolobus vulcani TaxID=38026 RepID=A0A7Z7FCV5_9EURY|nr:type II/IV secretion system ATPase subunit [Methanolobus vulcani]SDF94358.1 flagellar protein FlaI [Methanolobus vulcani]
MAKLQLRSRFSKKRPASEQSEIAGDIESISDTEYVSDLLIETIESADDMVFSGNGHISKEEIIQISDEPEIRGDQEISEDVFLNPEDDIGDFFLQPEPDIIVEESEVSEPGDKIEKKKKFGFKVGKKEKNPKKMKKSSKKDSAETIGEEQDLKPAKKKSKFNIDLKFGKKKKSNLENEDNDDITYGELQEQEPTKESPVSSLLKKIEQVIIPKPEIIEEMEFAVGEIAIPAPGVPQKEVCITYEVTSRFQYVHIEFTGESLLYQCLEPPLGESEKEAMFIIQNAFDKMAHSEILLVEEEDRAEALRDRFNLIVDIYRLKLTESQKDKFFYYLHKKYMGFDRMDLLMKDPYIEDITCNGPYTPLYINHRVYGSVATDVIYEEIELNNFVMRMAQAAGRHISVLEPIRDATLVDGSRANLTLGKEVTKRGSTFTIRRFRSNPVSCIDLMNYKTYDSTVLAYFWLMVEYKRSVLAAGGTASGKTTTLNALGAFIPPEYKIVSIEDTAEMNLMHPNWTQSITRAGFGGGEGGKSAGDIELFDLLKAALRQRPEYIVVGEVRGAEAGTLFQAISVGHPCMGTIHAGSIQELLSRVESEPMNVPRNLFASVDMVIFNSMIKVGEHFLRRALRIVEIVELDPERGDLITNPVFKWNPITDEYEYSGSSAMFDDINEEFGIDQSELVSEMDLRARYLEGLARDGITEYEEVARAIRRYSRQKDEMLEMTH